MKEELELLKKEQDKLRDENTELGKATILTIEVSECVKIPEKCKNLDAIINY